MKMLRTNFPPIGFLRFFDTVTLATRRNSIRPAIQSADPRIQPYNPFKAEPLRQDCPENTGTALSSGPPDASSLGKEGICLLQTTILGID